MSDSSPSTDSAGSTPSHAADLDETRLAQFLERSVPQFKGPLELHKFPGGQSNPTYRLEAASGRYVLRRKPFGELLPSAHAVDREYRVISALHPTGFPVPEAVLLCEDDAVIGTTFYVMGLVEGRSFRDGSLPDMAPTDRRAVYEGMVRTLAQLHNVDYEAVGLASYGKPGNYFARQVARWTKQYRLAQTDELADVERLIEYLAKSVPGQGRTSIIHGDYRIDNLIIAPDSPQVSAVLDWELSTIGDPLSDFAYLAMNWTMPCDGAAGILGVDHAATGIPTLDEAVEIYCKETGRDSLPDLEWYFAYCLFRLVGIVQGIKKRMLNGNASSIEAEAVVARLPMLAQAAWAHAQKAGA